MGSVTGLNPRPKLSLQQATELTVRLYGVAVAEITSLPSYIDQNFVVVDKGGAKYILKVINSEESKDVALLEVQTLAMSILHQQGFPIQTVLPTTTKQLMSMEEMDFGDGPHKYLVRLLSYLPGTMICKVPLTPQLLYETGIVAARMDTVLKKWEPPHVNVLQRENYLWNLSNIHLLEAYMNVLDGEPLQEVVKSVIHQYKTCVVPKWPNLRKCIVHGDLNDLNVLVQPDEDGGHKISGILDFGDMSSGYYIYELAITITHMMMEHPKPIDVGGPMLAGWESVLPLNETEKDCLYLLVLSRICQSLVLSRHSATLHPENEEYLIFFYRKGADILPQLWELGKEQVEKVWFQTAAQISDKQ